MIVRILSYTSFYLMITYCNFAGAANLVMHKHQSPANCTKINSHKHLNGSHPHKHRLRCQKKVAVKKKIKAVQPRPRRSAPVWSHRVVTDGNWSKRKPVQHRQKVVKQSRPVVVKKVVSKKPKPVVRRVVQRKSWQHRHPAIPHCTQSVTHTHKFQTPAHKHRYACKKVVVRQPVRNQRVAPRRPQNRVAVSQQRMVNGHINMAVIHREVRASGIYRGSINGVVSSSSRDSLKKYKK